jgi:hypothetical protein
MAISPQKAEELKSEEQDMINTLEPEIDRTLQGGERSFEDFPTDITEKVLKHLQKLYIDAGWDVEITNNDQLECPSLLFSKKGEQA